MDKKPSIIEASVHALLTGLGVGITAACATVPIVMAKWAWDVRKSKENPPAPPTTV